MCVCGVTLGLVVKVSLKETLPWTSYLELLLSKKKKIATTLRARIEAAL